MGGAASEELIHVLYITAIVAEAMTAALAAGRREMDWIGVFLLGCVTALGGGSVRDVLLDHHPLSWVQHPSYLVITGFAALATILIARHMHRLRQMFLFLDAIGLVVFTVLGMGFFINWLIPAMPLAIAFPIGRSGFSNRSYRRIRNRAAHTHSKADDAHP